MTFVQLDREFMSWESDKTPEGSFASVARHLGTWKWSVVRERMRVVVLAEAGSGKSEELRQQAKALQDQQVFAFYATVQDVAREELRGALRPGCQVDFDKWRGSSKTAWFFIDSIDEAKLDRIRLEQALRKIAAGIYGHEGRAQIVLSGRYTDWEFKSDLRLFEEYLPVPEQPESPAPAEPNQALLDVLNNQKSAKPDPPRPSVLLMLPLDEPRARLFASAAGVTNVDEFVEAVDKANLWSFAERPMDLGWLARYWRTNNRFGPFAEMLAESISERLKETDPARAKLGDIPITRSWPAMERIGAALTFGREGRLTVPDSDAGDTEPVGGFDLGTILPEWSSSDRSILGNKAVFDAATFGYARLHGDNEGAVRSFLTARWLGARQAAGVPIRKTLDLLFAEQYGIALVRPSMRETAAWLAIENPDVADEIRKRDPKLLLTGGDPGSLSLATRKAAITAVAERFGRGEERFLTLDRKALQRIVQGDFGSEIRALWERHKDNEDVRYLVLLILELGRDVACADIAEEAVYGGFPDRLTNVVGQRAFFATASEEALSKYAETFRSRAAIIDVHALWEGLEFFIPDRLTGKDFADRAVALDRSSRDEDLGLSHYGPRIVAKVDDLGDLQFIVERFAGQLGKPRAVSPPDYNSPEALDERAYGPPIIAAACKWLDAIDPYEVPTSVIDATLRLSLDRFHDPNRKATEPLQERLNSSAGRRRATFWRAAEDVNRTPYLAGKPPTNLWHLGMLGWNTRLDAVDVDWLIEDLAEAGSDELRQLAVDALMRIAREEGNPPALLDRIARAAQRFPLLTAQMEAWLKPRIPSPQEIEFEHENAKLSAKRAAEIAMRNKSYVKFVDGLKANPDQLRKIPPPEPTGTSSGVDGRLFSLWELLNGAANTGSKYAIDDVSPIVPIVGQEVAEAFRDALIAFWPEWQPRLVSSRKPHERNQISLVDCMGIAGVSLTAKDDKRWAEKLSDEAAERAAAYATLELNGFPVWLEELAARRPAQVSKILAHEIIDELDVVTTGPSFGVIQKLGSAPWSIAATVAEPLIKAIEDRPGMKSEILSVCLNAIAQGKPAPDQIARVLKLALDRFDQVESSEAAVFLATAFKIDPHAATATLTARLDNPDGQNETDLVADALPLIFGGDWFRTQDLPVEIPLDLLVRLIEIAFGYVRVTDDISRPSGVVYSPGKRDFAERARDNAFAQLANTPGPAAVAALQRFAELENFAIPPSRIQQLIYSRALTDSERAPWPPGEAYALEAEFDMVPQTSRDLQQIALNRLSDVQHNLETHDYSDRFALKRAASEREVQLWSASKLNDKGGRAYSLEREPHLIDEKEPDIRLKSKCARDVSLPIEVKVAESWSLAQLEEALDVQLGGKYLKARDGNHGVLLLVHQKARAEGWYHPDGRALTIAEVVLHLKQRAEATATTAIDSPKAEVALLDVSAVELPNFTRKPRA